MTGYLTRAEMADLVDLMEDVWFQLDGMADGTIPADRDELGAMAHDLQVKIRELSEVYWNAEKSESEANV